jgi:hypothetical protein
MIDINKEAEEYVEIQKMEGFDNQMRRETFTRGSLNKAFIDGANSKHVQAKIIQAQIDVLREIDNKCFGGSNTCKAKIEKLQQQLKQLEDEA